MKKKIIIVNILLLIFSIINIIFINSFIVKNVYKMYHSNDLVKIAHYHSILMKPYSLF